MKITIRWVRNVFGVHGLNASVRRGAVVHAHTACVVVWRKKKSVKVTIRASNEGLFSFLLGSVNIEKCRN